MTAIPQIEGGLRPDVTLPMLRFAATKMLDQSTLELNLASVKSIVAAHDDLLAALREYVKAQGRMLDKWSEGDAGVKHDLWVALHKCEEPARAAIARAETK